MNARTAITLLSLFVTLIPCRDNANAQQVITAPTTAKAIGDKDGFSFRDSASELDIYFGKQRIATYLKDHPELTRRAFINVTTPSGIQVTRNFPPRLPEDRTIGYEQEGGIDHPVWHPGIWLGYGDLNGNDYWRLKARVVHDRFVGEPIGKNEEATFTVRNLYLSEDGERTVCVETVDYRFIHQPEGIYLVIDAEYQSEDADFYFGDQEESGLAFRVASGLRVEGGNGEIINDRGEKNGKEIWGKEAKWIDYSGVINDRRVGLMVVPSPNNARPSWMHARDYGVVAINPFPRQPKERREPYVTTQVKKSEAYRLSYTILIRDQPANQSVDHSRTYQKSLKFFEH